MEFKLVLAFILLFFYFFEKRDFQRWFFFKKIVFHNQFAFAHEGDNILSTHPIDKAWNDVEVEE